MRIGFRGPTSYSAQHFTCYLFNLFTEKRSGTHNCVARRHFNLRRNFRLADYLSIPRRGALLMIISFPAHKNS